MSGLFFRLWQHLLPSGRAWTLVLDKALRRLFLGLSDFGPAARQFIDLIHQDRDPQLTRELSLWEAQFGLPDGTLTEQERRDRLARAWAAKGVQSPRGIQDRLQAEGFNVFVYEWWVPGSEPAPGVLGCALMRDPNTAGGYCIANKLTTTSGTNDIGAVAGNPSTVAGNPFAISGKLVGALETPVPCVLPVDPACWPYIWYVGGAIFGTLSAIPASRRDEFENLVLKLRPQQTWINLAVVYV